MGVLVTSGQLPGLISPCQLGPLLLLLPQQKEHPPASPLTREAGLPSRYHPGIADVHTPDPERASLCQPRSGRPPAHKMQD